MEFAVSNIQYNCIASYIKEMAILDLKAVSYIDIVAAYARILYNR